MVYLVEIKIAEKDKSFNWTLDATSAEKAKEKARIKLKGKKIEKLDAKKLY